MIENSTTTNWQKSLLNIQLAFAGSAGRGLNLFEALVMRPKDDKIFNDMLEKVKALANEKNGQEWKKMQEDLKILCHALDEQEERYQPVIAIRDDIAQDIAIGLHQITKYGQQIIEANEKANTKK